MLVLIQMEFVVNAPLSLAWQHLARVHLWPSWAKHIKSVELIPPGELTSNSKGIIRLANGIKSQFQMTEWNPPRNWKWVGPFLWLTVHYDHQFEAMDSAHTKLTWTVGAEGIGVSILGRLFAVIYNANLSKAIPSLIAEMKQLKS